MSTFVKSCVQVGTYTSGDADALMEIEADTAADLPAANAYTGYNIYMGSVCDIIADGTSYKIDSGGTWHQVPAGVTLDLTGYYTSAQTDSAINTALSGYYTDAQTDAAIAAAISDCYTFSTPPASISDNTDLNDLTAGVYAKASNVNTLSNLPSGFASAFYLVVRLVFNGNSWRRQMLMFPTSNTGTYNTILCFRRTENGTQGNFGPWVRFDGGTVL